MKAVLAMIIAVITVIMVVFGSLNPPPTPYTAIPVHVFIQPYLFLDVLIYHHILAHNISPWIHTYPHVCGEGAEFWPLMSMLSRIIGDSARFHFQGVERMLRRSLDWMAEAVADGVDAAEDSDYPLRSLLNHHP